MMNQIWIANVLLTRKCNLACSYCNIVKNYENMPEDYPKMAQHHSSEMKATGWIDLVKRITANNPECFFIFYGGEPTLFKGLGKLLKYCNENDVHYTVISNNTDIAKTKIYEIYDKIGPFKGFTSSVDPVAFLPGRTDDIAVKSRVGLDNLAIMKRDGIAEDVVAEITIMQDSLPFLEQMLVQLTEKGIYSSITAVDDQKTPFYDFSNVGSEVLIPRDENVRATFDRIIERAESGELLVHMPGLLNTLYDVLPSTMRCDLNEDVHNVSIEPNGNFRLCLRVRGINAAQLPYQQVISEDGELSVQFVNAIQKDYIDYCKGCNWTCPIMSSKEFRTQIVDHDGSTQSLEQ